MERTKVAIAEGSTLAAEGLKGLMAQRDDMELVAMAIGGKSLLDQMQGQEVDLVVLEVTMPEMDGIDTTRTLKKRFPGIRIVAYSALNSIEYINSMRIEGARGYVLKEHDDHSLFEAIRLVMGGHEYLSPEARTTVEKGYDHTFKDLRGAYVGLTEREREIITMVAKEKTNGEIAEELFLSLDTVKTHRKNLMTKLNVRNVAGLVRYAVDRGWV